MSSARLNRFVVMIALALLVLALPVFAMAAGLEGEISAVPAKVSAVDEEVTLTITVKNTGKDLEYPVKLIDSSNAVVTAFGTNGEALLKSGESATAEVRHKVTQKELSEGRIVYVMQYPQTNEYGEIQNFEKRLSAPVVLDGVITNLIVNRTITPEVARQGDTVIINYELINNGTSTIESIKLQESISNTPQNLKTLSAGQRQVLTFSAKMGSKDLTSSAEIRYKANGADQTTTVPQQVIPFAQPGFTLEAFCAEQNVNIGETATLTIRMKNEGNISYHNITISDEKQGVLFEGLSIGAYETKELEKDFVLQGPTEFVFVAKMDDNTGKTGNSVKAAPITVNAYDPDKVIQLSMNLSFSETVVSAFPATLEFTLEITNNSNVTAKNIAVKYGTSTITTIAQLAPGKSTTIKRAFTASTAGKFAFTAVCQDELKNSTTFSSNEIRLTKGNTASSATTAPALKSYPPSPVPFEQWKAEKAAKAGENANDNSQEALNQQEKIFYIAKIVTGALGGCAIALLLVTIIMRIKNAIHNKKVYDRFDIEEMRDCMQQTDREPVDPDQPPVAVPEKTFVYHDDEPNVNLDDDSLTIGAAPAGDGMGAWQIKRAPVENAEPARADNAQTEKPVFTNPNKAEEPVSGELRPLKKAEEAPAVTLRPLKGSRHAVESKRSDEEN